MPVQPSRWKHGTGLTDDEVRRLRKVWTEEPEVTLRDISSRFRLPYKILRKVCVGLERPKRASMEQLKRGMTAVLNKV